MTFFDADCQKHFKNFGRNSRKHAKQGVFVGCIFDLSVQDFGDKKARTEQNRERIRNPKVLGASRLRVMCSIIMIGSTAIRRAVVMVRIAVVPTVVAGMAKARAVTAGSGELGGGGGNGGSGSADEIDLRTGLK